MFMGFLQIQMEDERATGASTYQTPASRAGTHRGVSNTRMYFGLPQLSGTVNGVYMPFRV